MHLDLANFYRNTFFDSMELNELSYGNTQINGWNLTLKIRYLKTSVSSML